MIADELSAVVPVATPSIACHLEMIWAILGFKVARITRLQGEKLISLKMSKLRADGHGRSIPLIGGSVNDDANALLAAAPRAGWILFWRLLAILC